jgi:DNA repair photolyase
MCSPLMPGITDNVRALEMMARKAREADANFFHANALFLKPCSKATFLAFVHEHFPQLDASYAKRYEEAFVSRAYQKRIGDLVIAVKRKYQLGLRYSDTQPGTEENVGGAAGEEQQCVWGVESEPRWPTSATPASQRVMMTS